MTKLYCANCGKHTEHIQVVQAYATACRVCGSHTSQLMRMQADQYKMAAPDGHTVQVVENTPNTVTFYVEHGEYKGYYDYNKQTKAKQIRQG